jgi:hypothetical protein
MKDLTGYNPKNHQEKMICQPGPPKNQVFLNFSLRILPATARVKLYAGTVVLGFGLGVG